MSPFKRLVEPFSLDEFKKDRDMSQYKFIYANADRNGDIFFSIEIRSTKKTYRAQGSRMIRVPGEIYNHILQNESNLVVCGIIEELPGSVLEDAIKEYGRLAAKG